MNTELLIPLLTFGGTLLLVVTDVAEKARRERLLRHLETADNAHPIELAKYSLERAVELDHKH